MECGTYQSPQSSFLCNNTGDEKQQFQENTSFFDNNTFNGFQVNDNNEQPTTYKHQNVPDNNMYPNFQYNVNDNVDNVNAKKHSMHQSFSHTTTNNVDCGLGLMGNQRQHLKYSFDTYNGDPNTPTSNSVDDYLSINNSLPFSFSHDSQQPQQHHLNQEEEQSNQLPNLRKGSVYDGMLYKNHNCHGNSNNNITNNSYERFLQSATTKSDENERNVYKEINGKYYGGKQQRRMSLQHNLFYGRKDSYTGNFNNYTNNGGGGKLPYNQHRYGLNQNIHHKSSEPFYTPPKIAERGETSYGLYDSIKDEVKKLSIKESIGNPINSSGGGMLGLDYEHHHQMEKIKEEEDVEDIMCITPTFNQSPLMVLNEINKVMKSVDDDNDCQNTTFFSSNSNNNQSDNYLDNINSIPEQKRVMIQKRAPFRPRISIMKVTKRKCGWAYDDSNKKTFDVEEFRKQLLKAYEEKNNFTSSNGDGSLSNNLFETTTKSPEIIVEEEMDDDSNKPYMNIGIEHQAKVKPWTGKQIKQPEQKKEAAVMLFDPKVISHLTQETVAAYEALACSEVMPKRGRNIELALHILYENKGNIQASVMDLMRIDELEWDMYPIVSGTKYLLTDHWSKLEMNAFCEAIFKTEKNFNKMSKEIGTKSIKQCVEFYYFWKSACPEDYRKLKNLLRKKQLLRKALCKLPTEVYIKIKEKIDNAIEEDELPEINIDNDDEEMPDLIASITKNDNIIIEPRKSLETSAKVEEFTPLETLTNPSLGETYKKNINNDKSNSTENIQDSPSSYSWMHSDNAASDLPESLCKSIDNKSLMNMIPSTIPYHPSPVAPKKGAQPQADGFFHCRLCDKRFEKVKSLNAHMKSHAMKARAEAEAKNQQTSQQNKQHMILNEQGAIGQNIMHTQHQQFNPPPHPLNLSGVFGDTNNITNLFSAANSLTSQFHNRQRDIANTLFGQTTPNEALNPLLQSMFPQTLIRTPPSLNLTNDKIFGVIPRNIGLQGSNQYENSNINTSTILK
uniref:C2H2-type domain-containing protein n=1 Tax=Parastrongyloides trichosuri TaxID=131310 RepID=A0A0N5A2U8_PARTI